MSSESRRIRAQVSGSYSCRNDFSLTFVSDTEELSKLIGFSGEEIKADFHNSLVELVHFGEREKLRRELTEQLSEGDDVEVVIPVCCKDGSVIWLMNRGVRSMDENGQECISGIIVDITRSKQRYDAQKKTLELYQIILSQTENVIFEWDCIRDTISFSHTWEKIFGYAPQTERISEVLVNGEVFHQEDICQLLERLQNMREGSSYQFVEIRILRADGEYMWCRLRATGIYDNSTGKLLKVVGVIIDIDAEKKAAYALKEQAEKDSLTMLLNANTSRRRAEEYLAACAEEANCALLVIDLDNFKQINDRFGHLFGDAVLTEAARIISRMFRSQDIVGRIGGDEFMVVMKDLFDAALVHKRCSQLIEAVRGIMSDRMQGMTVSCSVGVALAREQRALYSQLFRCADQAMYQSKSQGGNSYILQFLEEKNGQ